MTYTCWRCMKSSTHPNDIENRYCANCHQFETPEQIDNPDRAQNYHDARRRDEPTGKHMGSCWCCCIECMYQAWYVEARRAEQEMISIDHAAESVLGVQVKGPAILTNVHAESTCLKPCPIHAPTEHHMRDWALNWRGDRGIFERICPEHGVGHPDPDTLTYMERYRGIDYLSMHGCCGCCHTPSKEEVSK